MLSTYPDILQVHKVNLVIILSVISNYNPPINFHVILLATLRHVV